MDKSIRVHIMGRDYPLLVREEDEAATREIAALVHARMAAFRRSHPEQPELTTAVITALALAEELFTTRERLGAQAAAVDAALGTLAATLDEALADAPGDAPDDAPDDTAAGDGSAAEGAFD